MRFVAIKIPTVVPYDSSPNHTVSKMVKIVRFGALSVDLVIVQPKWKFIGLLFGSILYYIRFILILRSTYK